MVKIKDFTLASKNLGGGGRAPSSYSTPSHGCKLHVRARVKSASLTTS